MYKIPLIPDVQGCVYKLWYSERYIIVKAKTLLRSVQTIEVDLGYFFKGREKEKNLYHDFYIHIECSPDQDFKIEVILQSDNPYELLKAEYIALEQGYSDINCMNKIFEPYVPKATQKNGKKSWINRGYYLNFMQWKKRRLNQNKTELHQSA